MARYSASFSLTLRVRLENRPGTFADLARAIADAGGLLDAIDLVRAEEDTKVRDVSVLATNADHADATSLWIPLIGTKLLGRADSTDEGHMHSRRSSAYARRAPA